VVQTPHPPINKLIRKKWKLSWLGYFLIVAGFVVFSFMGFGMRKIVLLCSFFFAACTILRHAWLQGRAELGGASRSPLSLPSSKWFLKFSSYFI
jgi:hypothetical protein